MAEWIVTFIISWIIFFMLVDKRRLKYTAWGGIMAMVIQLCVDTGAVKLGFYYVVTAIKLGGTSALFTFGAVFTMGTLFVQFIPKDPRLKAAHIIATATLFLGLEYLLVLRNIVVFLNWSLWVSYITNIVVFIFITLLAVRLNLTKRVINT